MQKRPLGQSGLFVSAIGFGCASYWGKKIMDDRAAIAMVHEAAARGVTFFDTGSSYSGGNAEPRLGRALAAMTAPQDLIVASKAGTRLGKGGRLYKDFSPDWIEESVGASLKNLGLSTLPVLHLHGPQIADLTDALLTRLEKLRQKGMVRALSVNSFDAPVVRHVATLPTFDCAMIDYHILQPERHDLVDILAQNNKGVFAGMALAGHLYSARFFHPKGLQDIWYILRALKNHSPLLLRGRKMQFIDKRKDLSGGQIALGWVLQNPHVSCAVFGSTRLSNMLDALQAAEKPLPSALAQEIDAIQQSFTPL